MAVERFLAALDSGDIQSLLDVLAPDVVMAADGGGHVPAIRDPARGAERVASLLSGFARVSSGAEVKVVWLNGAPAMRIDIEGKLDTLISLSVEDGRITRVFAIRNPEKLTLAREEMRLSRTE
jgi:ketosteroid isomerase-like protein